MGSIRFKTIDAEFLYSFPKTANDLRTIVWAYTFINRTGPPTYEELTSCLTNGLRVGIIRQEGEKFIIDDNWYDRIHMSDDTAENEIDSMLEFEDGFVNMDFNETNNTVCTLTEVEYKSILAKLRQV